MTGKENPSPKKERLDPGMVQRRASDPSVSAWVTASAGTGKTKVLTDRVLRLMLNGARPDQVLCLTFTRAAASVMTNRIRDELGAWATCDDETLQTRLTKLTGRKPDAAMVTRARQMFTEFLDSHGGMRIQTIHSFSQSLLRRFPIESGIPPYFDVMDDQTAAEALREAQVEVLKQIQKEPNSDLAKAVNTITPDVSEDDFVSLITELTYRRGQLIATIESHGGIEGTIDAVFKYLNAPRQLTVKDLNMGLLSDQGLDGAAPDLAALAAAAETLSHGSPAEQEKARVMKEWLAHPEKRLDLFSSYLSIFLTTEGEVRKRLTTKSTVDAEDSLSVEAARLLKGMEAVKTMNVARGTESLLRMSDAIMRHYSEKKRSLNLLDYDDLVHRANVMMLEDDAASWTLQKLPGDLKHILVDEAQDTNPDQWKLISAIAKEFFTNPARKKSKDNTFFVVGDEKQSIFSFQRADPEEFTARKKFFAEMVRQAGGEWREVEMEIAFRSSPAITQAVDAIFANPEAADGLFHKDEADKRQVKHSPFRRGQAGIVEVHPLIKAEPQEDPKPWSLPLQMESVEDPSVALADKIADQIKGWLDSGEKLESRDRPINPADIVILVRRRSAFVDHMVRALKKRDVPVAGADRMSLREQIVVMDLVALGEVALFPKDEYKLACVLKSPLIGMTDQQLEDLCLGRTADLWETLKQKAGDPATDKIYGEAYRYLEPLQKKLGTERPYEFYSSLLLTPCPGNDKSAVSAIYGRLGFEAEDPLVEFMNALERFEKVHVPSLQGFLAWLDAGEAEVKRDSSLNHENPKVHIMTVHGAKGLEAPIVILPDTTGIPSDNIRARPKFLWPEGARNVPLWVPRSDLESSVFTREREQAETERDREFRRLMYVALTRAADRLYVYGAQGSKKLSDKSWYSLIRSGLEKNLKGQLEIIPVTPEGKKPLAEDFNKTAGKKPAANDDDAADPETTILRFKVAQTAKPVPDGVKPIEKTKVVGIPVWARTIPQPESGAVERFRPSEYKGGNDNYSAPSPLEGQDESYFAKLGTIVHDLLEFLPVLPAGEREAAAQKYLAKPAWDLSAEEQKQTLQQVIAVLNDPEFGALFGANSWPEVSINGFVEKDGKKQVLSAQIDRLVVGDKTVLIVDYKNSQRVPKDPSQVIFKYIVQMAAYRMAVQQIYPDKEVKCALLFTRTATLMPLPAALLDAALAKVAVKPHTPKTPDGPTP
ncbi:MAG: double-strand break repair helicase AddA [Alphaproteobacteria bacterium]|nr:double-strand break repair helicase AddA [Alphaproteobacteria bacterium]